MHLAVFSADPFAGSQALGAGVVHLTAVVGKPTLQ
jgi:hypothetical protein